MYIYDRGDLFLFPNDSTLAPIRFGSLQGVELTFDFELKAIRTQLQVPVKFARGLAGVSGLAKSAQINGALLGQFLFNQQTASGSRNVKLNQSYANADINPHYEAPNFYADLGVTMNGVQLTFMPQPIPHEDLTSGQYSIESPNDYRFSEDDIGNNMLISYIRQDSTGKTVTFNNAWMQEAKPFGMLLSNSFDCKQSNFWLPACVSKQLILPTTLEQFSIQSFAFEVQQDSSGEVGRFSFAE